MIIWDESMSTGVSLLDAQHKMLFQKFNEFSETLSKPVARENTGEMLDFLQFYVAWHFGREEKCMDEYKCPVADHNKQAHAEFVSKFKQFYTHWQEGTIDADLVRQTHEELETWLVNHVKRIDTQLGACVKHAETK
jgi:hemerythrin